MCVRDGDIYSPLLPRSPLGPLGPVGPTSNKSYNKNVQDVGYLLKDVLSQAAHTISEYFVDEVAECKVKMLLMLFVCNNYTFSLMADKLEFVIFR